jgi:Tol biopolymer transport system component/predicted Ser/Thr protein kinase
MPPRPGGLWAPMIDTVLGHYRILEKLGAGGMGVVYKARDLHLDRFVALKVLPPEELADPDPSRGSGSPGATSRAERRQRFTQEAKAASSLNHPNIITIHDVNSDGGVDFIAMEFVQGQSLDQLIPPKGMPLNDALRLAAQVADALAAAHAIGVVHRDIKPSNIMVGEQGRVKVLDFGLAKLKGLVGESGPETAVTAMRTEVGRIVGTLHYMSPEQAQGRSVDERSDIFSFGSMLYEMLCGQRPFQGDSAITTLAAIIEKEPPPLPVGVPATVEEVLERCLRKDPSKRYQHIADVAVELQGLDDESVSKPRRFRARGAAARRWRWFAAAGASLLALAAAVWFVVTRWERPLPPPSLVTLTSYPGEEDAPALSPDGKQVAFSWNGGKGGNTHIYVQLVGDTRAAELTTDPRNDVNPCWSPDGRRIAFLRRGSKPLVSVITLTSPLPGGSEQLLREMAPLPTLNGAMSWSPDGQYLLVSLGSSPRGPVTVPGLPWGLYLVPVAGGEPRRLTSPPTPLVDWHPHFSPDGRWLAFSRTNVGVASGDLYVLPLTKDWRSAGPPSKLTREPVVVSGLAWTTDGKEIVYGATVGFLLTRLHRVPVDGKHPPERIELAGLSASLPTISQDRLAFARNLTDYDIWRFDVERGGAEPLIRSSFSEWTPQFSPDGRKVAFTSNQDQHGGEIWIANADGSNPWQLTRGPHVNQGSARWSPDGGQLAFDSQAEDGSLHVYTIDAAGGPARELTAAGMNGAQPSWSRDGRWIYFTSSRTGRFEIWRCPFPGGTAEQWQQMTTGGGWVAFESSDGRTLYYSDPISTFAVGGRLHAKPLDGGPDQILAQGVREFAVAENGIFYVGAAARDGKLPLLFYDVKSRTSRELGRVVWAMGLTASPDGKSVLYSASLYSGKDLMLIDNFR